jgi:hypothetical protein
MKKLLFILPLLFLAACEGTSSIQVQNNLSKAVIRNVEWGGLPLSSQLIPGEKSTKISIRKNDYYEINLPAKNVIKFYLDVNGDKVYLETKKLFELGIEQDILIEINDSTKVVNPLIDK